jgi:hypothetical protein
MEEQVHQRLRILIAGLLLTAAACSRQHPADLSPITAPALVEVTNNYAQAVEIFIQGGGTNQRLGLVNPGMVSQFKIPPNLLSIGGVVFQASPSDRTQPYRSGELLLHAGSVVELGIASVLFNSTATIQP